MSDSSRTRPTPSAWRCTARGAAQRAAHYE